MIALLGFVLAVLAPPFKSKSRLEAENAALRHQLIVLRRMVQGRVRLTNNDRWFFIQLYRWFPSILKVLTIVQPETLVRWHRAGFRRYWRWKSRPWGGRPQIDADLRALIRRMSMENPLWGAPRIHGELLKLGFEVAQSSVRQIHGQARRAAKSGMAHLSAEPCWSTVDWSARAWCLRSRPKGIRLRRSRAWRRVKIFIRCSGNFLSTRRCSVASVRRACWSRPRPCWTAIRILRRPRRATGSLATFAGAPATIRSSAPFSMPPPSCGVSDTKRFPCLSRTIRSRVRTARSRARPGSLSRRI